MEQLTQHLWELESDNKDDRDAKRAAKRKKTVDSSGGEANEEVDQAARVVDDGCSADVDVGQRESLEEDETGEEVSGTEGSDSDVSRISGGAGGDIPLVPSGVMIKVRAALQAGTFFANTVGSDFNGATYSYADIAAAIRAEDSGADDGNESIASGGGEQGQGVPAKTRQVFPRLSSPGRHLAPSLVRQNPRGLQARGLEWT